MLCVKYINITSYPNLWVSCKNSEVTANKCIYIYMHVEIDLNIKYKHTYIYI